MLTLAFVVSVGLLSTSPNVVVDQQRISEDSTIIGDRQLSGEPLAVSLTYESLVSQNNRDRLRAYGSLSNAMKAAMWSHQLRMALAEHTEFTDEQHAILEDAITLLTPEFFSVAPSNPDWPTKVDEPLQKLTQRARVAFGFALTAKLLAHLGPDEPTIGPELGNATRSAPPRNSQAQHSDALQPRPNDLPNCSCSTTSDYCAVAFGPDWYCLGGGCIWGLNWGCGTALQYPCTGLCDLKRFQG